MDESPGENRVECITMNQWDANARVSRTCARRTFDGGKFESAEGTISGGNPPPLFPARLPPINGRYTARFKTEIDRADPSSQMAAACTRRGRARFTSAVSIF